MQISAATADASPAKSATSLEAFTPYALSLLRLMAGLLFLEHGMAKLFGFPPHGAMPVFPEIEFFAGSVELIGGSLLTVGLFTRVAALLTSGEMAIGYFLDHFPKSFFPLLNGGDAAAVLLHFLLSDLCRRRSDQPRCLVVAEAIATRRGIAGRV